MKKLEEKDAALYLGEGLLTKPFLEDSFVLEKVMLDFNRKQAEGKTITKLESLFNWIASKIRVGDKQFNEKYKFQRDAKEIWESSFATGCTDYALLFATFSRQIGVPTTFLHTAENGWLMNLLGNKDYNHHYGHSFCECFYEGRWILVDPTFRRIEFEYDCSKINLSYKIGPSNIYIPYFRGLDLGKRTSIKEHNEEMDAQCRKINIDSI